MRTLVLDEADKLLSDASLEDTVAIYDALPERKQVLAFSATYTPSLLEDCEALMEDPKRVMLCDDTVSLKGVRQYHVLLPAAARSGDALGAKLGALKSVLERVPFFQAVVFCAKREGAARAAAWLSGRGFPAAVVSGQLSQAERLGAMEAVRSRHLR